jgi:hypothetical protein
MDAGKSVVGKLYDRLAEVTYADYAIDGKEYRLRKNEDYINKFENDSRTYSFNPLAGNRDTEILKLPRSFKQDSNAIKAIKYLMKKMEENGDIGY